MSNFQSAQRQWDVAIVGGGIMGCATAYFLQMLAPCNATVVIEPDPTYEFASTPRASGGCRVQFSCDENINMSLFSLDFIKRFESTMATAAHPAKIDWVEGGYLFIVPPESVVLLEANVRRQQARGAVVALLDRNELKKRFPSIHVDDIGAAAHTPHDGWCDPNGLLWGFRRKVEELGVRFVKDRVTGFEVDGNAVRSVKLATGDQLRTTAVVNAAGAWAGEVARLAGMTLPVAPLRRYEHYFTAGRPIEHLPYVKDMARLAFRSEGRGFSGGLVDGSEQRGFHFDIDHNYFERVVWPALAHRFPAFEAAKCHRTWSGLYEQCELDGNPIIGPWVGGAANLYTIAGFSGHGMMHAPAAGRAIAELITTGRFQSLDLSRLGYARVITQTPYAEAGIL